MATALGIPVIDTDSHLTEPPDLWTSRMSKKHLDVAPRVVADPATGRPRWKVGDHLLFYATQLNHAGWHEFYPSSPYSYDDADAAGWDADERLRRMDEMGITVQVLFPNLLGFTRSGFREPARDAAIESVRVSKAFQTEFAAAAPARLLPQTFLPFWDLDASVAEMERCAQ